MRPRACLTCCGRASRSCTRRSRMRFWSPAPWTRSTSASRALALRSALIVPLRAGNHTLDAITLVSAESGRTYSTADLPLAMELARRAAIAVERAQLHRQAIDARANAERSARVADRLYSLTARLTGAATPEAVATAVLSEA